MMALARFAKSSRPTMLIVYLNTPGIRAIVMQPMDEAFSLAPIPQGKDWRYMASVTTVAGATKMVGE
jgi:hypothetical protein